MLKNANFTKNLLREMKKKKPEELLTMSDSKNFCSLSTDIDLNMTPHTLRKDKVYLQRKLNNSESKRLQTKLGIYITDVDHSDLIVEGNLYEMGKNFLKCIGKDKDLLKTQSKFQPQAGDENYNLQTFNSMWLRERYFDNLIIGNRSLNEQAEREYYLDFYTLRKKVYINLPKFVEAYGLIISKNRKSQKKKFTEQEAKIEKKNLIDRLMYSSVNLENFKENYLRTNKLSKTTNISQTYGKTINSSFDSILKPKKKPSLIKLSELKPHLDRVHLRDELARKNTRRVRRKSKIVDNHPKFSHPDKRGAQLLNISTRLDKIVKQNLKYYENKLKKKDDLRQRLKILKKDQSYKRSVQSNNIVKMLRKGEFVGVEKIRQRNERIRRANYTKLRFKSCAKIWKKWFKEAGKLACQGLLGTEQRAINDIMSATNISLASTNPDLVPNRCSEDVFKYLRLLLQDGVSWIQEDLQNIKVYIDYLEEQIWICADGSTRKGLGGGERKLLMDLIDDILDYLDDVPTDLTGLLFSPDKKHNLNKTR